MKNLIFNGEKKPWIYLLKGRSKAPFPAINRTLVEVPGMHGAHLTSHRLEPLIIEVPIGFKVKNDEDALSLKDELASWLYTANPAPLEFEDEPGRIYYAVVQNTIDDFERMAWLRQGTIQFLCVDPFAYGSEQSYSIASNLLRLANEGTAMTYPVFDLVVKEDSTRVSITNLDNLTPSGESRSIILGQNQLVGQTPVERKKLVMHDTMQSTNGWQGALSVDSGYVSGTMATDHEGFYAESYGDESEEKPSGGDVWIGPSLQKSLPKPLNSFIADIYIKNMNHWDGANMDLTPRATGIIEVYMRDINDNMVCKFQFGDLSVNAYENVATFVTNGGRVKQLPSKPGGWDNFDGIIQIVRDTGYYYPYIAVLDKDGTHIRAKEFGRIIPLAFGHGAGSNEVASIQVAIRKPHSAKRMPQRIKEIKVWDFIGEFEYPDNSVPVLFKAGDRLHIDVAKGLVLLNGERRNDLFSLETDFFGLIEGLNTLEFSENVQGTVTFKNRYL